MTSTVNPFNWRGTPRATSFKRAPSKFKGVPPPLLNGSARNGTANINTERDVRATGSMRAAKGDQA